MFSGQAAIDYLQAEAVKDDPSASSHWKKYHSDFKFNGSEFAGLVGFGGNGKKLIGLRLLLSRLLQRRFRRFGDDHAKFVRFDALAAEVTATEGRAYVLDVLRQVLTISLLHTNLPNQFNENATSCVIGDGFASMATLLLASKSAGRVVLVNLTKTLLVDLWYLKLWMGSNRFETSVDLVVDEAGVSRALENPSSEVRGRMQVIAIEASNHQLMQSCPIDVVINVASMQEMNPPVIAAYFDDMRAIALKRDLLFYCCNREEKKLPDQTVTRFTDYPWRIDDRILVDGLCPWHQYYYSILPSFYRPYDGPIMHRLVTFNAKKNEKNEQNI